MSVRPRLGQGDQRTRKRTADLRTSKTVGLATFVGARLQFLPAHERALLEQVFVLGRPLRHLAALTGEEVRHLRRRIKRLVDRMSAPAFDAVIEHSSSWTPQMAAVGAAVFVRGLSARQAVKETGVSYHITLGHARTIRTLGAELKAARKRRGEAA